MQGVARGKRKGKGSGFI